MTSNVLEPSPDRNQDPLDARAVRASADDLALVARLLKREEAAFEALVDRYHGALTRLARVFVGDQAVAEDVVQDTWVGVLNGLKSFEGRSSLKTWIFSILTHKAKTRGARERRAERVNLDDGHVSGTLAALARSEMYDSGSTTSRSGEQQVEPTALTAYTERS